ncbi:MAG: hypothetical protein IKC35_01705 [Clostridia bacterium]|nr:hypothetical protein [Clostridia bacterium]
MKLLLILTVFLSQANTFSYGYLSADTVMYADENCLSAITTLPKTYFAIVLNEGDDSYYVSYKDVTGYVKNIEIVDYEPVTKYADATFTANNDGYPVKLRKSPNANSEVVIEIPHSKSGYYYGDVSGSALIEQVGTCWHFVCYNDGTNSYHGYVYSSQVRVSEIKNNVIEKVVYNDKSNSTASIQQNTDFLLIVLLCVPSVLIMYIIFSDKERKPRYKE